jgi:hypothetical protein
MSTKYKATTTEDAYFITITSVGWVDIFNPTARISRRTLARNPRPLGYITATIAQIKT